MRYQKKLKKKKIKWPVTILIDDREKKPWQFDTMYFKTMEKRLPVGDYSFVGYEDQIVVEKKSGLLEFIKDISGGYRKTFKAFLSKLSKVPHAYILIEDDLCNAAKVLRNLPIHVRKKIKINEYSINYWIIKIEIEYNVSVIFIGKLRRRKQEILNLFFISLVEKYGTK